MKKIGLVMCFKHRNYGSMLQSFALQHYFIDNKIEFECVNYKFPSFSFKTLIDKISLLFIKSARIMKIRSLKRNLVSKFLVPSDLKKLFKKRCLAFDSFSKKHFISSIVLTDRNSLIRKSKEYSAVILGSDQVLHPINLGTHFYDLSWVDDSIPKFGFSSSFGVSKIPFIQRKKTVAYLNRFKDISTREKTGSIIIESLIHKKCQNTIDPTLLYTAEQWTNMLNLKAKDNEYGQYIFCYFLGKSEKERSFARELKKNTGLKIVSLVHLDEYIPSDNSFGDERPFDIGPAEFVNLIKNASYVCTDSFHGTVFSLLYKKKVAVFDRYSNKSSVSANSRIHDLLYLLDIDKIFLREKNSIFDFKKVNLDFITIEKKLTEQRTKAEDFLQNIIKDL